MFVTFRKPKIKSHTLSLNATRCRTECNPCPAGSFGNTSGASSLAACIRCPIGRFSDSSSSKTTACTPCPLGKYQDERGETACKSCKEGKHGRSTEKEGASSETDGCVACEIGKYGNTRGANNASLCDECPSGRYGANEGLAAFRQCTKCPTGKYRTASTGVSKLCLHCEPGTYAKDVESKACNKAPLLSYTGKGWTNFRGCPKFWDNNLQEDDYQREEFCYGGRLNRQKLNGYFCASECSNISDNTIFYQCKNKAACRAPKIYFSDSEGGFASLIPPSLAVNESDVSGGAGNCSQFYTGKLCNSCAKRGVDGLLSTSRDSSTGAVTCKVCPNFIVNLLLLTLCGLCFLGLVTYIIHRKTSKNRASLTRIVLTFFQFQSNASFLAAQWPLAVTGMYDVQEGVTSFSPDWISLDCLTTKLFDPNQEFESMGLFQAQLITIVLPLGTFLLIALFFLVVHGYESSRKKVFIWNDLSAWRTTRIRIIRTVVIVEWLIWSTVVRYTLLMLNCRPYGEGDLRLVYDLEVKCDWDSKTSLWRDTAIWRLFVPSSIVHIVLFPGFMCYVLWANSSHFADKEGETVEISTFYSTYGFLVAGYRRGSWITIAWELTVLARRMIVSICFVFLWDMPQTQTATVFLVLLTAAYLHLFYRPYDIDPSKNGGEGSKSVRRGQTADRLERLSLTTLLLTYLSAFYFLGELESVQYVFIRTVIAAIVIFLNIFFLAYFLWEYFYDKAEDLEFSERVRNSSVFRAIAKTITGDPTDGGRPASLNLQSPKKSRSRVEKKFNPAMRQTSFNSDDTAARLSYARSKGTPKAKRLSGAGHKKQSSIGLLALGSNGKSGPRHTSTRSRQLYEIELGTISEKKASSKDVTMPNGWEEHQDKRGRSCECRIICCSCTRLQSLPHYLHSSTNLISQTPSRLCEQGNRQEPVGKAH